MKFKRTFILVLVFLIGGVVSVFADSLFEKYTAKKIAVTVNNISLGDPGLAVDLGKDGLKIMVPLEEISNTIGLGLITWNESNNTLNINKPNVHLTTYSENAKTESNKEGRFGQVVGKGKTPFAVHAQVDNLQAKVSSIKVTITDPFGRELDSYENVNNEDMPWVMTKIFNINFRYYHDYTVNFYMKTVNDDKYQLVGQKVIPCVEPIELQK